MQHQLSLNCCNFVSRWKHLLGLGTGWKSTLRHPRHYFSAALSLLYLQLHEKKEGRTGSKSLAAMEVSQVGTWVGFCETLNRTPALTGKVRLCTQTWQQNNKKKLYLYTYGGDIYKLLQGWDRLRGNRARGLSFTCSPWHLPHTCDKRQAVGGNCWGKSWSTPPVSSMSVPLQAHLSHTLTRVPPRVCIFVYNFHFASAFCNLISIFYMYGITFFLRPPVSEKNTKVPTFQSPTRPLLLALIKWKLIRVEGDEGNRLYRKIK